MSADSHIGHALLALQLRAQELDTKTVALFIFLLVIASVTLDFLTKPSFPFVNYSPFEVTYLVAKIRYIRDAAGLIKAGLAKFGGPFTLVTDAGPKIIFPPSAIDAINKADGLNFNLVAQRELFGLYPGFEAFNPPPIGMFEEAVRVKITRNLSKFTRDLSNETTLVLKETLTDNKEWHDVQLKTEILKIIARITARVFVGEELARNADWQRLTVNYTTDSFIAAGILRLWPAVLRPVVHWILPYNIKVRAHMKAARKLLGPIIEERKQAKKLAMDNGMAPPVYFDAMEWFEETSRGRPYDEVATQMSLALASIHTTADLLCQAVFNLCLHPEMIEPLRREAVAVLGRTGWRKTALVDLKLMDSFLKETQRMKPIGIADLPPVSMSRLALKDVTLSDGTYIPKDTVLAVSSHRMWDPEIYPDPHTFDGGRFLKMRQTPGLEHKAHLVSTSVDHTAFSHGTHACPGRFFAANETKIALVHLLLKYDFRVIQGAEPKPLAVGTVRTADPRAKVSLRRRDEEIQVPTEEERQPS